MHGAKLKNQVPVVQEAEWALWLVRMVSTMLHLHYPWESQVPVVQEAEWAGPDGTENLTIPGPSSV
jgi:hypothetical protein